MLREMAGRALVDKAALVNKCWACSAAVRGGTGAVGSHSAVRAGRTGDDLIREWACDYARAGSRGRSRSRAFASEERMDMSFAASRAGWTRDI